MSKMSLVDGMPLPPHACVNCGSMGQAVGAEELPKAVFCEGVDINWGDSVYFCSNCARIAGQLVGLIDAEVHNKVKKENKKLSSQVASLTEERDTLQGRVDRMIDGARARKEAKEAKAK